jgi:hypothetical protein
LLGPVVVVVVVAPSPVVDVVVVPATAIGARQPRDA